MNTSSTIYVIARRRLIALSFMCSMVPIVWFPYVFGSLSIRLDVPGFLLLHVVCMVLMAVLYFEFQKMGFVEIIVWDIRQSHERQAQKLLVQMREAHATAGNHIKDLRNVIYEIVEIGPSKTEPMVYRLTLGFEVPKNLQTLIDQKD